MIKPLNLLVALLTTMIVFGQQGFTLEDAKAYAIENNLKLKNGELNIENARQQMIETRGMGLPQIDMSGQFNNFINIPVQVADASAFNPLAQPGDLVEFKMGTDFTANGTIKASQLIFNGSYIVGLQVARFYQKFETTNTRLTQEDIVFNVIQAYEIAAVAKENKVFLDSLVIVTEKLVEKQKAYLELDMMLQEDFDQLQYSLSVARNAALSADIQYNNGLALLKFSMGYPADQPLEINDDTDVLMKKRAVANGAITDNLSYTLLSEKVQLSAYNVKNNKFASWPTLNAFFQHTYNAYRNEFNLFSSDYKWYPQTLWGLQLNIPVFSGFQRHARVKQAEIQLLKDQNDLSYLENSLQFQEVQYKNNYRSAESRLDLEKQNLELAKSIYEKSLIREEIGKSNSIVVTQKYNQLIQAQAQVIGAKVDLFNAKLQLDKLYNNILSK